MDEEAQDSFKNFDSWLHSRNAQPTFGVDRQLKNMSKTLSRHEFRNCLIPKRVLCKDLLTRVCVWVQIFICTELRKKVGNFALYDPE